MVLGRHPENAETARIGGGAGGLSMIIDMAYRYGVLLFAIPILVIVLLAGVDLTAHLIRWEETAFVNDSIVFGMASVLLVVIVIALGMQTGAYRRCAEAMRNDATFRVTSLVISAVTVAVGITWVLSTQFIPGVDEGEIYRFAGEALGGDWSMFEWGRYLSRYPNNWGIFLFDYALQAVFGIWQYMPFEIVNAFVTAGIFMELAGIGRQLGLGRMGQLMILLAGVLFFPVAMYSQMIYGNLIGTMFACAALRHAMAYMSEGKVSDAVFGALCMAAAMFFKSTMLVYLAALLVATTVSAIARRSWQRLLFPVLVVVAYLGQSWVTKAIIVAISGQSLFSQIPITTFIAMGLQDGPLAPGWWNDYLHTAWHQCGGSLDTLSTISKDSISQSLSGFTGNPRMATDFFVRKFLSTWTNPTFQCFATARNGSIIDLPDWVRWLLSYRGQDSVGGYLDVFVSVVTASALVAIVAQKPKNLPEGTVLVCMLIDGAVLYLLVSETKARYALMFWIVLIPLAVIGLRGVANMLSHAMGRIRRRNEESIEVPRLLASLPKFSLVMVLAGGIAFVGVMRPTIADYVNVGTADYQKWLAEEVPETAVVASDKVDPMYDPD